MSQQSIDEQITALENQIHNRRNHMEATLGLLFMNVKSPGGYNAGVLVSQMMDDMMEQMRQSAIVIVLDMLTHPQRFEMFAQLASRLKEQEKDI